MARRTKRQRPADFYERLKVEYVTGTMSAAELARAHKLNPRTLEKHVTRGRWVEERRKVAYEATRRATEAAVETVASELKAWNDDDLRLAKAIRGQVARAISDLMKPGPDGLQKPVPVDTLRSLAGTAETVQRIGRLALGATTANQGDGNGGFIDLFAAALEELDAQEERGEFIDVTPRLPAGALSHRRN